MNAFEFGWFLAEKLAAAPGPVIPHITEAQGGVPPSQWPQVKDPNGTVRHVNPNPAGYAPLPQNKPIAPPPASSVKIPPGYWDKQIAAAKARQTQAPVARPAMPQQPPRPAAMNSMLQTRR